MAWIKLSTGSLILLHDSGNLKCFGHKFRAKKCAIFLDSNVAVVWGVDLRHAIFQWFSSKIFYNFCAFDLIIRGRLSTNKFNSGKAVFFANGLIDKLYESQLEKFGSFKIDFSVTHLRKYFVLSRSDELGNIAPSDETNTSIDSFEQKHIIIDSVVLYDEGHVVKIRWKKWPLQESYRAIRIEQ